MYTCLPIFSQLTHSELTEIWLPTPTYYSEMPLTKVSNEPHNALPKKNLLLTTHSYLKLFIFILNFSPLQPFMILPLMVNSCHAIPSLFPLDHSPQKPNLPQVPSLLLHACPRYFDPHSYVSGLNASRVADSSVKWPLDTVYLMIPTGISYANGLQADLTVLRALPCKVLFLLYSCSSLMALPSTQSPSPGTCEPSQSSVPVSPLTSSYQSHTLYFLNVSRAHSFSILLLPLSSFGSLLTRFPFVKTFILNILSALPITSTEQMSTTPTSS